MTGTAMYADIFTADVTLSVEKLKRARQALLTDIAQLDVLHEECVAKSREMLFSIRDGEVRLKELRAEPAESETRATARIGSVESRGARELVQMALQIRLVQSSGRALIKKIQSAIRNAEASVGICEALEN